MKEVLYNSVKIVILSDGFYGADKSDTDYRYDLADILLQRTVTRLNRLVKPDITIILGDLFKNELSQDINKDLFRIKSILDKLESSYIIIPGNLNCNSENFYQVFTRPEMIEDINGLRFVSFLNENPAFEYQRRLRYARNSYSGPIISIQQNSLFSVSPQKDTKKRTDENKIISTMKETGVLLSIGRHHQNHPETVEHENITFVNVPELCKAPFPYTVINIDKDQIQTEEQNLSMDRRLQLSDNHIHTQLAYCNDNIMVDKAIKLTDDFGLSGLAFTEHSGQLYFESKRYWDKTCLKEGMHTARNKDNRMADYIKLKQVYEQDSVRFGLEVDCDYRGKLLLKKNDLSEFHYIIGAMHGLPGIKREIEPGKRDSNDFLYILEKLLGNNIDVLAHPFRVFRRSGWIAPEELFMPVANLLRKYNTAAEINFHTNEPPVEFIRICLNQGVSFSLGSDAHHMAEIGDFTYHLSLLKETGFDGDLNDILIS